jgi:hypothetical protein
MERIETHAHILAQGLTPYCGQLVSSFAVL